MQMQHAIEAMLGNIEKPYFIVTSKEAQNILFISLVGEKEYCWWIRIRTIELFKQMTALGCSMHPSSDCAPKNDSIIMNWNWNGFLEIV